MKPKKSVSYFPVGPIEQDILLRIREPDLAERAPDVLEMLEVIATQRLSLRDLDQAVEALRQSQAREGLETQFDVLEGKLRHRIEQGLSEIEGRLSRRLGDEPPEGPPTPDAAVPPRPPPPRRPAATTPAPAAAPTREEIPAEASVAYRVAGELVWGPSAGQFYVAVWRWLFEHGHVGEADLPIRSGRMRYAVAKEPVHPTGKDFFVGHEVVPGVWVEAHMSRGDILRRASTILTGYDVPFVVEIGDR